MHRFDNPVDEQNREIIIDLVSKKFDLDKKSLDRFKGILYYPDIDSAYSPLLENDLRARFRMNRSLEEKLDLGWEKFQIFSSFIKDFNITYGNFKANKLQEGKSVRRIFKFIYDYYLSSHKGLSALKTDIKPTVSEYYIEDFDEPESRAFLSKTLQEIAGLKLPNIDDMQIVLSMNFADWFMSATKETWNSCFNFESSWDGIAWAQIPGFAIDKNRAFLYITNGHRKQYLNIDVQRFVYRTFLMLDDSDNINALRWYPTDLFNGDYKGFPIKLKNIDYNYKPKYNIDYLTFKNGYSCYAYQDHTKFDLDNTSSLIYHQKGGHFGLNSKNEIVQGSHFMFVGTLYDLNNSSKTLMDVTYKKCFNCGEQIEHFDLCYDVNGNPICEDCRENEYIICYDCGALVKFEEAVENSFGLFKCRSCHDYNTRQQI